MELAKYKEVMTWNVNNYKFIPNPKLTEANSEFLSERVILSIIKDCLLGLHYLHDVIGIIHRDIKPQNILICENMDN